MEISTLLDIITSERVFTVFQTLGIIGSLILAGHSNQVASASFEKNTRTTQSDTLFRLNSHHYKIWKEYTENPKLQRVLAKKADLEEFPVTLAEKRFIRSVILHTSVTFKAIATEAFESPENLAEDISETFSLPIPEAVLIEQWRFLDKAFQEFIAESMGENWSPAEGRKK